MDAKIIEEVQTRYILHWNYRYSNLKSKKYHVHSYLIKVKNQIILMKYMAYLSMVILQLHKMGHNIWDILYLVQPSRHEDHEQLLAPEHEHEHKHGSLLVFFF